jgi:hypothetical protein
MMNLLRRVTEGLGAWLHYEYCCDRSEMFSEKYMAPPVGILLSSAQQGRVFAEFKHPILKEAMTGRGRRPALDFVVSERYPVPKIAIETKWIGRTRISVESVVWDLVRLALLSHHFDTQCYFVLGGQKKALTRFFETEDFSGPKHVSSAAPILNITSNHLTTFPFVPSQHYRVPLLRNVFQGWPADLAAPQRITTTRTKPFPDVLAGGHFQVYAWKIACPPKKEVFLPKKSRHYPDAQKKPSKATASSG